MHFSKRNLMPEYRSCGYPVNISFMHEPFSLLSVPSMQGVQQIFAM